MPETRPIPPNRTKTRSGCLRCKQRKIKCDETYPHCNQCTRKAYECPGYKRPLKWSSKYEVARGNEEERKMSQTKSYDVLGYANKIRTAEGTNNYAIKEPSVPETDGHNSTRGFEPIEKEFSTDDIGDDLLLWSDLDISLLLPPLEDEDTGLSRHYFSLVCHINSCFDSDKNFFRVEVGSMMGTCPVIYHSILSMSAAHLARQRSDLVTVALKHKTKAISCLKVDIMKLYGWKGHTRSSAFHANTEALLGSILLGITEGWHHPSQLGIIHLHGARLLFKSWISDIQDQKSSSAPLVPACSSRTKNVMIGIVAYWEAIASFVVDQPLDAVTYLDPFCDQDKIDYIHPNPWTGICTPLFVYLARVGTLGKQRFLLNRIFVTSPSAGVRDQLHLVEQARETEKVVLCYRVPVDDRIEDTEDSLTPVCHLQKMSQIYRLVALLELYQSFPELCTEENSETKNTARYINSTDKVLTIATSVLTLIRSIPPSSGVNALLALPLTIAGSTLQPTTRPSVTGPHRVSWDGLCAEILSISSQESIYLHWPGFVRERLDLIYNYVGVVTVCRVLDILEKVWARADMKALVDGPIRMTAADLVRWTHVMVDERLETILG